MAKSKQNNHEYYANYETCRNRWFNDSNPDTIQNEDYHLGYKPSELVNKKHKHNNKGDNYGK